MCTNSIFSCHKHYLSYEREVLVVLRVSHFCDKCTGSTIKIAFETLRIPGDLVPRFPVIIPTWHDACYPIVITQYLLSRISYPMFVTWYCCPIFPSWFYLTVLQIESDKSRVASSESQVKSDKMRVTIQECKVKSDFCCCWKDLFYQTSCGVQMEGGGSPPPGALFPRRPAVNPGMGSWEDSFSILDNIHSILIRIENTFLKQTIPGYLFEKNNNWKRFLMTLRTQKLFNELVNHFKPIWGTTLDNWTI